MHARAHVRMLGPHAPFEDPFRPLHAGARTCVCVRARARVCVNVCVRARHLLQISFRRSVRADERACKRACVCVCVLFLRVVRVVCVRVRACVRANTLARFVL